MLEKFQRERRSCGCSAGLAPRPCARSSSLPLDLASPRLVDVAAAAHVEAAGEGTAPLRARPTRQVSAQDGHHHGQRAGRPRRRRRKECVSRFYAPSFAAMPRRAELQRTLPTGARRPRRGHPDTVRWLGPRLCCCPRRARGRRALAARRGGASRALMRWAVTRTTSCTTPLLNQPRPAVDSRRRGFDTAPAAGLACVEMKRRHDDVSAVSCRLERSAHLVRPIVSVLDVLVLLGVSSQTCTCNNSPMHTTNPASGTRSASPWPRTSTAAFPHLEESTRGNSRVLARPRVRAFETGLTRVSSR